MDAARSSLSPSIRGLTSCITTIPMQAIMAEQTAPKPRQPELSLSQPTGEAPDSRLVELIRLLARRAARRHLEHVTKERGSSGS
jgi:hypothetical protein